MKKFKKIAVITAEVFNEYHNKILLGITEQCASLGYDVHVITMSFNLNNQSLGQTGEENIFTLINSEAIDGIIFACGNFASTTFLESLEIKLIEMHIPVVAIDCETMVCETLNASDTELFEQITDHFIECHNCTEIMCLTGMEGVPQTHTRLQGYINSLEKHDLPVDDELIVYGDFWKNSARKLSTEFVSGMRKLPQAIVCANDIMAIELCNSLVANGIRVPEDVLISGYDASQEGSENTPSITSLMPLNRDLGARAVCALHKKITGFDVELAVKEEGYIVTGQSCGCGENFVKQVEKHESYNQNIRHYADLYKTSNMIESLLEAENLDELLLRINNFRYIVNGLDVFMLCLCENWDNIEGDNDNYIKNGYSENMIVRMILHNEDCQLTEIKYKSKDILPEKMYEYVNKPSAYFYLPMHFKERCFGYSVFKFKDINYSMSSVFATWCRNINISLEFLRVRTKLLSVNQRISLNSIRDTLTGIYNRKGFKRFSDSLFKKAQSEKTKLFILVADLDMLKQINDNYGHIEGDNAITVCANVLNTCCQNNEVCARIGGDEYAIVGCFDYDDNVVESYINYINAYFERYNSTSEKPYHVGASLGYYCDIPDEGVDFQYCFNIADKRMYANKHERKKSRDNS